MFSESQPLWGIILGNGFWHLLEHFTQFYLDRSEVWRATQLQQAWADKVTQEDLTKKRCARLSLSIPILSNAPSRTLI